MIHEEYGEKLNLIKVSFAILTQKACSILSICISYRMEMNDTERELSYRVPHFL